MSSISFDATLDTNKLDAAIKQSNQTVKEWSQGVEKSTNSADTGFNKLGKSFKSVISEQKVLIKSIEKDVKSLQKAYDDVTAGRAKQATGVELRSAKKALAEEQGTLLGLQKQQIEQNTKEAESQEGIIGKLKGWVLGLVTVGAALKIAKGIIDSTAGTQLKFKEITAEVTAGVGYFFRAIASGDWSNFFHGLREAIKGARDFVDAMDDIENKRNELNIKTSELDIKIGEARADSYDEDTKVVKASLVKIIALQEEKFEKIAALSKKEYETNLKKAATDSGLEAKKIEYFLKEYSSLEKLIELGEEYNNLVTSRKRWEGIAGPEVILQLDEQIKQMGKAGEEAGKYVTQISKVTPEARKILSDFLAKQNKDIAAFNLNNRRDKERLLGIEKQEVKDKIEAAKIENKIKAEQELLDKAVAANNAAEIKAIGERIRKLQEELVVRQRIASAAISATMTREAPISKITGPAAPALLPGGLKIPSTLAGVPTGQEESRYIQGTVMLTKKALAEVAKAKKKYNDEEAKALDEQLQKRNEIVNAAASLVYQMGVQVGLTEQQQQQLGGVLNIFTALVSGNYVKAAASLLSNMMLLIPSATERFANEIRQINRLLDEQNRLIELSERKGGGRVAREQYINLLKESEAKTKEALRYAAVHGKPTEALLQSLLDIRAEIAKADQDLADFLVGGITEITIADSIAQGFRDGKTSVDDFADYMNDILSDALITIFTQNMLDSPWFKIYVQAINDALMDGVITPLERGIINMARGILISEQKPLWDIATQGLDDTATNVGLTGEIRRNITEETGTMLGGLFRRFADDQRVAKDYSIMGVTHLVGIERNTYDTVMRLDSAIVELKSIVTNTKGVPVGDL